MRSKTKANVAVTLLIAAALVGQSVWADGTVGDLARIQSETILLKAKADQAAAAADLRSKSQVKGVDSDSVGVPAVKSVFGVGKHLYATFVFASGVTQEAKVGDALPGRYKVVSISVDQVVLKRGGRRMNVGFSAVAPTISTSSSQQGLPYSLPGMTPNPLPGMQK